MSIDARNLRPFRVDEYHAMVEAGILGPDDRVELVDGRIVTMAAIGSRHARSVDLLTRWLVRAFDDRAIVRVQNPVTLDDYSEPEPDLSVVRERDDFYLDALPRAEDVYLLIEVADATGGRDRRVKIPRYAAAGVPELWFFDLVAGRLEVHREPTADGYAVGEVLGPGDGAVPEAFDDVAIDVGPILA